MDSQTLYDEISAKAEISFARSSGPGGQNVNKLNTKVLLRIRLDMIQGWTEQEYARVLQRLSSRLTGGTINEAGEIVPACELVLQVQDERSQLLNREIAIERAHALLLKALQPIKPRRPTKPSRASKERRISSKKLRGAHKKNRGSPGLDI